jgi:hypothetical protein
MVIASTRPAIFALSIVLAMALYVTNAWSYQEASAPKSAKKPASTAKGSSGQSTAKGKSSSRSAPPIVMSKAAADAKRKPSPFRMPPGSSPDDRYNSEDWSEVPPWRQTSFFGLRARGQFFIYVVDQSGSMIDDDRLTRATIELRRSVNALQSPQRFEVIFYNDGTTPMPGGPIPRPADQRSKDELRAWLRLIDPDGGTEPKTAVGLAIALRPDAVFLLSDGEYPPGTAEAIARLNSRKIPIHCVDIAGGQAGDQLQRIARDSGGQYASRPGSLHAAP